MTRYTDVTDRIIRALNVPVDIGMKCTDESVKRALTAPFPDDGLIPISESAYGECSDCGGPSMFVNGDEVGETCELESIFTNAIRAYKLPSASRPPPSASEDTFHTLLDTTVVYPIQEVFNDNSRRVQFRRNQVARGEAASSSGFAPETRPDVVFTIGGIAFFFGEEKSEVAPLDAAEKDIKHKSVWTPFTKGTKEFDICYGTLGRRVQFYILRPNGYGGVTLHPIERELHLDRMVDCVLCVKMAINAFRINLWQYDTQRPRNIPDLAQYGKVFRKHCVIESMGSYFLKTIYVLTHADAAAAGALRGHLAARVDAIQAIVERVASGNPPHCVEIGLIERKRMYLRYTLEPVMLSASSTTLATPADALQAILHTLRGLHGLHGLDPPVIHNDVRWQNVLYDHARKMWRIIDFDRASSVGEHLPSEHPAKLYHKQSVASVLTDLIAVTALFNVFVTHASGVSALEGLPAFAMDEDVLARIGRFKADLVGEKFDSAQSAAAVYESMFAKELPSG